MKEEIPFNLSLLPLSLSHTITKVRFMLKCQQFVFMHQENRKNAVQILYIFILTYDLENSLFALSLANLCLALEFKQYIFFF